MGGWLQLELEGKARGGADRAALVLERAGCRASTGSFPLPSITQPCNGVCSWGLLHFHSIQYSHPLCKSTTTKRCSLHIGAISTLLVRSSILLHIHQLVYARHGLPSGLHQHQLPTPPPPTVTFSSLLYSIKSRVLAACLQSWYIKQACARMCR